VDGIAEDPEQLLMGSEEGETGHGRRYQMGTAAGQTAAPSSSTMTSV